jgi:Carboxypeptidase regulatory-like domain/TonB dependent receptor-like, beta-barrel
MRMLTGRRLVAGTCFWLFWLGVCTVPALAQSIHDGKLTGTITSEDRAVMPGATVEISSPSQMGGTRTAITSANGTYLFLNVTPGRYTVTASMAGFKTSVRENIDIGADTTVTLDVVLPVGAVSETVTVSAEGPMVDVKSATTDTRIDKELIAKLPTSRDAFYDLALTAPGMFDSSSSNSLPSPTAYGSATNENVFLINGVNSTDPEAGAFGTLVNVNYDAVEEVRIVGLGSKAEYGSFSGATIDVVTKSGSNAFHGTGAVYSLLGSPSSNQPGPNDDLGASWLFVGEGEQLAGETKSDWETSATVGGPIRKDNLWFFGAFDYLRSSSLPPRWSLQNESWSRYVDGKISAVPAKNHLVWGSYHYENNDGNGWKWGSEPAWDTTMTYGAKTKNHSVAAQWQWSLNNATAASAKFLAFSKDDDPYLPDDRPDHPGYINWWKWGEYGINGAFPYADAQKANRKTIQADLSHYAEGFLGQHDIKFGVQYTKGRGNRQEGYFQNYVNFLYPYRWTRFVSEMQEGYGDNGLLFYNNQYFINPFLTVRTADSTGFFVDDRWSPTKRLTFNLGFRFDRMTTKYDAGKVYELLTSPEELNDPPPVVRDRASTDNIFDFKTWSPRLGVSYMLTEDGKTVARAAYGRYYMPLSIEFLRRFGPDAPTMRLVTQYFEVGPWSAVDLNGDDYIDTAETRNAARMVSGLTPLSQEEREDDVSWTLNVGDNVKDQHTDEVTLNVEREVAKNVSVSASYIFKHTTDLFANIPINEVTGREWDYERVPFTTLSGQQVNLYSVVEQDYDGNGVIDSDDIVWINDHDTSRVQNMPTFDGIKPKRDYHGLQFVVNKRYSDRWQALASFLYSRSEGMARRSLRQDINVEGPMFWDDNWMSSINQTINNLNGPLPFTPKYEFKLSGSYLIPRVEFDVGARLRMHSGRPVWQQETVPQHTENGNPPGSVIGTGSDQIVGVDVKDPAYLPAQTLLDLHFDKVFKVSNQRIHFIVDGFNIFNSSTPTDVDVLEEYGKVTAIPQSRRFRFGARYEF